MKRLTISSLLISSALLFAGCGGQECGNYYETTVETTNGASLTSPKVLVLKIVSSSGKEELTYIGKKDTYPNLRSDLPSSVCVYTTFTNTTPWEVGIGKFSAETGKRRVVIQVNQTDVPFCLTSEQIKQAFDYKPPHSCRVLTPYN